MTSTRPGRLHPTSTWAGAFVQHHPPHRLMMKSTLGHQHANFHGLQTMESCLHSRIFSIFPSRSDGSLTVLQVSLNSKKHQMPDDMFDSYGPHINIHLCNSQNSSVISSLSLLRAGGRPRSTPEVASQRALHWTRRCSLNPAGHALSLALSLVLSIEHRFPSDGDAEFIQLCQIYSFLERRTADRKTPLALSICGCCISKYPGNSSVERTGPWKSPPTSSPALSRPSPTPSQSTGSDHSCPEPPSPTSSDRPQLPTRRHILTSSLSTAAHSPQLAVAPFPTFNKQRRRLFLSVIRRAWPSSHSIEAQ